MDDPPQILLLFVLGVLTDTVWCATVRDTAAGRSLRAAIGNAVLAAIGLGSTWCVIEHHSLLGAGAYIAGCFLGTFFSTQLRK
jgi:hypothetical protein